MNPIEKWLKEIWKKPVKGKGGVMGGVARLYGGISATRRQRQSTKASTHPFYEEKGVPIVVVGNIHLGGTGKTPILMELAQELIKRGLNVGVISRGHGRDAKNDFVATSLYNPWILGDEPAMIGQRLDIPVAVATRRMEAYKLLLGERPDLDIVLSDDGMQHYRMPRDVEIAVFPIRNEPERLELFPLGPLRENVERLKHCDMVVLNLRGGVRDHLSEAELSHPLSFAPDKVKELGIPGNKLYLSWTSSASLHTLISSMEVEFKEGEHPEIDLACGIGDPASFKNLAENLGFKVASLSAFPDHSLMDFSKIEKKADWLLLTEKDAVKLVAAIGDKARNSPLLAGESEEGRLERLASEILKSMGAIRDPRHIIYTRQEINIHPDLAEHVISLLKKKGKL